MTEVCVRVAVRIRPLLPKEVLHNHEVCVRVVPGSAQVKLGSDRLFSFDHAFGPTASQDEVYEYGVQPLVESLVQGYNATVFCYGQTGSGKTYTVGGGDQDEEGGMIDRVAHDVFSLLEKRKKNDGVKATVQVSYMELHREELRDLLELQTIHKELHIREDEKGNTVVVGAQETEVTSAEELLRVFEMGNALRHTGTTGMNEHSSRSHAIFTLQVNICCHSNSSSSLKSVQSSKLCLVDLAGSERAGKTGNTGTRLKESVHINAGLLALGNVIRALSDHGRNRRGNRRNGTHIPYRDAKITRLLRDSLGGNTHTLMVACVSPSHHSVAETLNVLQFATKVRHVRNCPGAVSTPKVLKSGPDAWNLAEARLEELEFEVKTLRELLKDKEKDIDVEREKTSGKGGEGEGFKQSSQTRVSEPDEKMNQKTAWQYCLLVQEAAALLAELSDPSPSLSFKQRLQDWQQRLTAVAQPHHMNDEDCSDDYRDQTHHLNLLQLREELNQCKEVLGVKEQQLEEKDTELKHIQKEVEILLEERRTQFFALEEEKERSRIQTEQLVNQQIVIDRLFSNLRTAHGTTSEAMLEARTSGYNRPHSVPLIRNSCVHRASRKIHSSPPAYSLERVMAAFRMRGHLLLAEIEEKDEVHCPFIEQQAESNESSQEKGEGEEEEVEEEDSVIGRNKFRRSLNRTWTSRQKKLPPKEKSTSVFQVHDGNTEKQQQTTDSVENQPHQRQVKKVRRASVTERRIHELTVNMRMKEELIKELDKTERETEAVGQSGRHTGEKDLLVQLSTQSQQVRVEVYHSLQHMRLQKAQLQSSLRQLKEIRGSNRKTKQSRGQSTENLSVFKDHQEESNKMLCDSNWLEEEEEHVLQKRAQQQELYEELTRREEVLLRKKDFLRQKNRLEVKMLHFSQALSRDLLHVSMQLESVEEQLQSSSSMGDAAGVSREELEKERDMLMMKRDTLDAQLRDNRVLTADEEHSLLQLEEAIEALDEDLKFKDKFIKKRKEFLVSDSFLHSSQSAELAQHSDFTRKLKKLSPAEALELLIKYFNKVVCLREAEHQLRLRCEELELQADEQEAAIKEMEAAMQRLVLDADRRLTQQHRDHQNNIQLFLQKLKENVSGEVQQAIQDKLQHLEKELFFYKSSSRQLKKKLKELFSDSMQPDNQPSHRQMHNMQIHKSTNKVQAPSEEVKKTTHIATTHTKIYTEQPDAKTHRDSSDCQSLQQTKMSEHNQMRTPPHGKSARVQSERGLEMTPVRLCRRELRQISKADLQVFGSATRRQQSAVDASTESMMEDSIEVTRKT